MNPPVLPQLLEMCSITKRFPGVLALSEVNFEASQGEVVALVAGKSTLMKILSGMYLAGGGEITFKGKPVHFTNPRQGQAAGIATIYQELNQVTQPHGIKPETDYIGENKKGRYV